MNTIRGYVIEDVRGFYMPHLRAEHTDRETFVIRKDGQQVEDGVEIKKQDAYKLAQWLLKWSAL